MKAIHGTKTKNDRVDSEKIAHLLRSNMLPQAYCCSPDKRPIRDLLRRRAYLIKHRSGILSHMSEPYPSLLYENRFLPRQPIRYPYKRT